MLIHQTLEKLHTLRLHGIAKALEEQRLNTAAQSLGFNERFGMLVDAEYQMREDKRVRKLVKRGKFRTSACPEDIDYRAPRSLNRDLVVLLLSCDWIRQSRNVFITGPTGVGKSWIAEALANQAARKGFTVRCERVSRLVEDMEIAHSDGSIRKLRDNLAKNQLLILDDWGLVPLTHRGCLDLKEIIEDRYDCGATLITSQLPINKWHEYIGEGSLADAILDRLIHRAYRMELQGGTMRKQLVLPPVAKEDPSHDNP